MESSNDYTKEEDFMMWELHEIRKNIAKQKLTPDEINRRGEEVMSRFLREKSHQYPSHSAEEPMTVHEPKKDYDH